MPLPQNVTELLQALVRIPSVNPHGMAGNGAFVGEQQCAEFVGEFLEGCGAVVELQQVQPGRPNVIGRLPSDLPGKPLLLLVPHLDTVSVNGMTIPPFAAEIRDGKVFGRGASDTKGPMAAMLWALFELKDQVASLPYEIWFAGMMSEEAGQDGAKAFVKLLLEERGLAPANIFALIGEPTGLQVVYTTKGAVWIRVETRGKSVHASNPDAGVNAIYKMADVIRCVAEQIAPGLKQIADPVLGSPTISLGMIEGGSKTNIVPDFCKAEIDLRTIPGQDIDAVLSQLQAACPSAKVEITSFSAPLWTDPNHPLIDLLQKTTGAACVSAPWFCDAAVFSAANIPSVAAGPGSIAQAHTEDEWIAIDDLVRGVDFYRSFLRSL
jgi:acetylornithine deacetylase/succinyl-diaminopimelate desuccinylase-like protein